jgi:hypothetical protein
MEDDLKNKMEDNLKKMEDDLKKKRRGKQNKMEDDLQKKIKMEGNLKCKIDIRKFLMQLLKSMLNNWKLNCR